MRGRLNRVVPSGATEAAANGERQQAGPSPTFGRPVPRHPSAYYGNGLDILGRAISKDDVSSSESPPGAQAHDLKSAPL